MGLKPGGAFHSSCNILNFLEKSTFLDAERLCGIEEGTSERIELPCPREPEKWRETERRRQSIEKERKAESNRMEEGKRVGGF